MPLPIVKRKIRGRNPQSGFVLIVALIGIMILLAVGYFALTVSTSDMRIASRLVDERKAFSAAEAGVHILLTSFDFTNLGASNVTGLQVDAADPSLTYSTNVRATNTTAFAPGYDPSTVSQVFEAIVTGRSSTFDSMMSIAIGIAGPPVPADTLQGRL